jgi:hypothetical protein
LKEHKTFLGSIGERMSLGRADLEFSEMYDTEDLQPQGGQDCRWVPLGGVKDATADTLSLVQNGEIKSVEHGSLITAEMLDDLLKENPRLASRASQESKVNWVWLAVAVALAAILFT